MKEKKIKILWSLVVVISLLLWGVGTGNAAVVTGRCDNCHTMHNSQAGTDLDADGPYDQLLVADGCVGCHTGTNDNSNAIPYVMSDSGTPTFGTDTLAGGNFYWVSTAGGNDDTKGHNVLGISSQDTNITASEGAPGDNRSCGEVTGCHATLAVTNESETLTGKSGCEGCHLNVMHHTNDGVAGTTKYVSASPWYRFLSGHEAGDGHGVKGIEHVGWGYGATDGGTNHNEYLGVLGTPALSGGNMTAYCCGCHGNFHDTESAWTRHPSDLVITTSGEYASVTTYGYKVNTPVARPAGFNWGGNAPSADVAAGTDMVMCLSCHVAHGSPYSDMLRWNYDGMVAGSGTGQNTGCFYCHSQKDGG